MEPGNDSFGRVSGYPDSWHSLRGLERDGEDYIQEAGLEFQNCLPEKFA